MNTRKPVVLLAPLDWGLGHTVRCIPIIKEILNHQCEVIVACNSKQKLLLIEEFQSIRFVDLEGYDIKYGKTRLTTFFKIFFQLPGILTSIRRERKWLVRFMASNKVDGIISDNRYGFSSRNVPSIFITHQLKVRSGFGRIVDDRIQKFIYHHINKFRVCWVPDWKNAETNVAGELSHPKKFPSIPVKYLGCLSRFEKCPQAENAYEFVIILSGPEPQRTILENIVLKQLKNFNGNAVFIRGVFDDSSAPSVNNTIVLNSVPASELNRLICNAKIMISRAGYTSIMDFVKLAKKTIVIPTPGQAEQEYLATCLHERKLAFAVSQDKFSLKTTLQEAREFTVEYLTVSTEEYKKVVKEFSNSLHGGQTF